jgi:hypothetical protein
MGTNQLATIIIKQSSSFPWTGAFNGPRDILHLVMMRKITTSITGNYISTIQSVLMSTLRSTSIPGTHTLLSQEMTYSNTLIIKAFFWQASYDS